METGWTLPWPGGLSGLATRRRGLAARNCPGLFVAAGAITRRASCPRRSRPPARRALLCPALPVVRVSPALPVLDTTPTGRGQVMAGRDAVEFLPHAAALAQTVRRRWKRHGHDRAWGSAALVVSCKPSTGRAVPLVRPLRSAEALRAT